MTREKAVQRIDQASEENSTKLDLSGLKLKKLPPEIAKCTKLETLLLGKDEGGWGGNKLTEFPDAVLELTNLKILDLSSNRITSIPEAIGQLSNLTGFTSTIIRSPPSQRRLGNCRI